MNIATVLLASEAHEQHWLWPAIDEVIWATAAFLIVAAGLWWKGLPAAKKMAADRRERIAKELADAEAARTDAEAGLAAVQNRVANAANERERILSDARATAKSLEAQIAERSQADAASIRARGLTDIESSKSQATADLQAEVERLALGAAEAVVSRNLDDATQRDLVEAYIGQVGS